MLNMKRMIACFCAALLAFFAAACSQSDDKSLQTTTASTTAATTVSAAVSGDIGAKLDKIISDDEYEGLVYITKDGAPVYESYTGTDESGKTLSADTTMLIGSVSKQFCAAAVLMLRDEGKLSVDDTLDKYFPDFTKGKNITLKNLLSMRSGIADMVNQGSVEGISPDKTDAENTALVKDWIFNHELLADPGTVYAYSNSNYFLLGEIIPETIARAFTTEDILITGAAKAMRIMACMMPLIGFQMVTTNFFQSIGLVKKSIFLSLTRQILLLIPLLLILPLFYGENGVWYSLPISDFAAAVLTTIMLKKQFSEWNRQHIMQ